jgi:hypothetical protein
MPLVDLKTDLKSLRFGKDRKGGGNSRQPYVQIGIPETPFEEALASPLGVKDFLLRGGLNAVTDTAEDLVRLGSFFTNPFNPSGLLFTAKQNILSNSAVRTQTSGTQNEGIYTPLSTLSQAGVVAFGGHLNKQGKNPFELTGAYSNNPNLYSVKVKSSQPTSENRLVQIYEAIENNAPVSTKEGFELAFGPNIISYNGGPGSNLGVGRTDIRYADQRTGLQNANLAGSPAQTQRFKAPKISGGTFDYSVFERKTIGESFFNIIFNKGVSAQYLKQEGYNPELFDGLINDNGQLIRGGQDATGDLNSLATTRPGYFYGKPGETGKAPFIPGNYLQSLSLETNGGLNTLNRNWNSVSKTFSSLPGLSEDVTLDNQMNTEGEILYNPSVTKDGNILETDASVTYRDGAASLTQKQILNKILSRTNGTTQVTDFRREIGPDTIGFENYSKARANGSVTLAPDYANPNVRFEGRVNLGDPGKKGLIRSNYSKGAIGLNGKVNVVDKINAMYMYNADSVTTNKEKNDFVKFRFAVINPDQPSQKTFVHFRAIFDGAISDNMTAKWDAFNYLGRAEDLFNYNGFTRSISFNFTVVAQSKPELAIMYQKLNYLQSSLTPNYNLSNGFMRGNIHQLTIGGYFYEQPGVITSLNYTMPADSPWEIAIPSNFLTAESAADGSDIKTDPSVKELPHRIEVQVGFNPIHTFLPQIVGSAYDTNNPNGIFGMGDISQRYIALASEESVSLYTKGTPYKTQIDEYDDEEGSTGGEE